MFIYLEVHANDSLFELKSVLRNTVTYEILVSIIK